MNDEILRDSASADRPLPSGLGTSAHSADRPLPTGLGTSAHSALQRGALLLGDEGMKRLAATKVIIFGVGGVGSWCAEALVRAGVGSLTMVDADVVDVSNINRQLPATTCTIGRPKAEVMAERLSEIAPWAQITPIVKFYSAENSEEFRLGDYDIVIDAIDSVASKAHLLLAATRAGAKVYSSMGAARRIDPGMVKVAEFWKVRGCPLARALRDKYKKEGVKPSRKIKCVYSDEPVSGQPKGTLMAVTATFGLRLASLALL